MVDLELDAAYLDVADRTTWDVETGEPDAPGPRGLCNGMKA